MSSLAGGEGECMPVPLALKGTLMSPRQLASQDTNPSETNTLHPLSPSLLGSQQYPDTDIVGLGFVFVFEIEHSV